MIRDSSFSVPHPALGFGARDVHSEGSGLTERRIEAISWLGDRWLLAKQVGRQHGTPAFLRAQA
jgi:hypothetical protein